MKVVFLLGGLLSIAVEVQGYQNQNFRWGYEKNNGPNVWGEYIPQCNGYMQSPITLPTVAADSSILNRIEYYDAEKSYDSVLINDGKAIQTHIIDSSRPSISGSVFGSERYLLDYAGFGVGSQDNPGGSEHGMNGKQYPGEKQEFWYNHKFASFADALKVPGNVAVTAQLIEISKKDNPTLDGLEASLHYINGTSKPHKYSHQFLVNTPVFKKNYGGNKICVNCDYFFYKGSLAFPPCTEGVLWHVYMDTYKISERQMNVLRSVLSSETGKSMANNNRNPQPINFRDILQHRENTPRGYSPQSFVPSAPKPVVQYTPQPNVPYAFGPYAHHAPQPFVSYDVQHSVNHAPQPISVHCTASSEYTSFCNPTMF